MAQTARRAPPVLGADVDSEDRDAALAAWVQPEQITQLLNTLAGQDDLLGPWNISLTLADVVGTVDKANKGGDWTILDIMVKATRRPRCPYCAKLLTIRTATTCDEHRQLRGQQKAWLEYDNGGSEEFKEAVHLWQFGEYGCEDEDRPVLRPPQIPRPTPEEEAALASCVWCQAARLRACPVGGPGHYPHLQFDHSAYRRSVAILVRHHTITAGRILAEWRWFRRYTTVKAAQWAVVRTDRKLGQSAPLLAAGITVIRPGEAAGTWEIEMPRRQERDWVWEDEIEEHFKLAGATNE